MKQLTGNELTTIVISVVLLIIGLTPFGQRTLRELARPLNAVLIGEVTQQPPTTQAATGNVVRFTSEPFARRLLVRVEGETGVSKDDYALSDGVLVGVVYNPAKPFTTVQLLTDPQFKAVVQTNQGAQGVITGELNALLLTKVPQNQPLQPGDEVLTSGLDGRFISNIPIGVVREVFEEDELLKSAYVEPYAQLNGLNSVHFSNE